MISCIHQKETGRSDRTIGLFKVVTPGAEGLRASLIPLIVTGLLISAINLLTCGVRQRMPLHVARMPPLS